MKKAILTVMCIAFCVFVSGCGDENQSPELEHNEVVQTLADKSYVAKEFTDSLFVEYMASQSFSDKYTIDQTAYGFYTSDISDSIYIVGYTYSAGGSDRMYGYKILIGENEICSVLEEGAEVADFLFSQKNIEHDNK